ncbi:MAG: RNA polymerase sigma factor [Archangium gephyra]|uniref:RNA polymerase sigma factor n=1 Tax=Archangium gephyra TaxID=48 RepID=A0A2W5SQU0_9BACT|nr:MAG: RNA polymerase sigma factor [Archangium gephyra]
MNELAPSTPAFSREYAGSSRRLAAQPRRSLVSAEALPLPRLVPTPPPTGQSEARLLRLVDRIKKDDVLAFEELYRLTRDDVSRTLFHLVGARPDLEDMIQDTYLRLLKAVPGFRGESQFRTFLYRVCANVALMNLRWWRRRREDPTAELPDGIDFGEDPERAAQAAQASRLVHRALEKLGAKKRIVFVYHELCGMGPEEIAQIVGASYNTVRSRLHHARLEFSAALKELARVEAA